LNAESVNAPIAFCENNCVVPAKSSIVRYVPFPGRGPVVEFEPNV
jgi:hypothetical protein